MRRTSLALVAALTLVLTGCTNTDQSDSESKNESGEVTGELTVFAAASLTEVFDEIVAAFTSANPGVSVTPVYDGSSTLAAQLLAGAAADVFASADDGIMREVTDAGVMDAAAITFATNLMQIGVQPGNPDDIHSLGDLASRDVLVVLCAPEVPCGEISTKLLNQAGVDVVPVSEEQNVKAVVTKIALGEADAGLVYATDVLAASGRVEGVPIEGAPDAANSYQIDVTAESGNPVASSAFIDFVRSDVGQGILDQHGFGSP